MRKLIIGMALASTVLATPALARDKSWYVEGDAGGTIMEDQNIKTTPRTGSVPVETYKTKVGYDGGGAIGYDFGHFRLESEASYRRAMKKRLLDANGNGFSAGRGELGGSTRVLAFMENALIDFGPDDGLQGFVGGGVGVARVQTSVRTPIPADNISDSSTGFAWQVIAGVRVPVSDHWDVGLKYRYFQAQNANRFVSDEGIALRDRVRTHSLLGTLTYNFGEPAAPPPPPPPVVCNKGPYIVFFDWDKSDITPEAATILDSAVTAYGNCGSVPIMLAGYTDLSGTQKYNLGLSARRNASVTSYLTAHGIAASTISSQAFGKLNPRVPTANGVRELQNRRVEITYGPGSGN